MNLNYFISCLFQIKVEYLMYYLFSLIQIKMFYFCYKKKKIRYIEQKC